MSRSICGIWSTVVLGVSFLLPGLALADNQQPPANTVENGRVAARVVQPADEDQSAKQREPRVILRDLRAREGFDALQDEHENFDRFFRFHRRLAEHHWPSARHYFGYDSYRAYVNSYISLSEYERYRKNRDRHRREMEVRKAHALNKHEQALLSGLRLLKQGEYGRAVVALTLAAKLDHGDPACRIHLAQARLAQGHYRKAALALRRALQLQPKLVYLDLHLDAYYQNEGELDEYVETLDKWVQKNATHAEVYFLLGFLEFQRGNFDSAHAAFKRVAEALPYDDLTRDYVDVTRPPDDPTDE
jgi:tetratricopeptide (TPR) repeat protein